MKIFLYQNNTTIIFMIKELCRFYRIYISVGHKKCKTAQSKVSTVIHIVKIPFIKDWFWVNNYSIALTRPMDYSIALTRPMDYSIALTRPMDYYRKQL